MIQSDIDLKRLLPFTRANAARLAQTASRFTCRLTLECEGKVINAKSMLGLLSLPPELPMRLSLVADGEDEQAATEAVLAMCK